MNQRWTLLKRWLLPLATRVGLAMPVLLLLGSVLMLVAIWWLGPQWAWREQHPLASIAHRSLASLVLVLVPLLCWLLVLRRRYVRLQAERNEAAAAGWTAYCRCFGPRKTPWTKGWRDCSAVREGGVPCTDCPGTW